MKHFTALALASGIGLAFALAEWQRKSGDDGRKVIDTYRGM